MAEHSSEISTLNTLIATTIDSINGYEDAAGHSEAGRFQQIFRDRASGCKGVRTLPLVLEGALLFSPGPYVEEPGVMAR